MLLKYLSITFIVFCQHSTISNTDQQREFGCISYILQAMQIVIPEFPMGFPKFPVLTVERLTLNMGICGNYYVAVLTAQSSCINNSFKQTTKYCVIFTRNILIIVNPGQFGKLDEEVFSHAAAEVLFGQIFHHIQRIAACRRSLPIILQKVFSIRSATTFIFW